MAFNRKFFEEFCAKHGEHEPIDDGHWLLFADGATLENSPTGMGMITEPPKKEFELQKLILQFREIRLAKAVQAMDDYQQKIMADDYAYMRQKQIMAELERLQAEVKKWKELCAVTRRKKNRADPNWISPERLIEEANNRAHNAEQRSKFQERVKKSFQV